MSEILSPYAVNWSYFKKLGMNWKAGGEYHSTLHSAIIGLKDHLRDGKIQTLTLSLRGHHTDTLLLMLSRAEDSDNFVVLKDTVMSVDDTASASITQRLECFGTWYFRRL